MPHLRQSTAASLRVITTQIIFIAALVINNCSARCTRYGKFGDAKCEYLCHCNDNRNCDERTGDCSDRCDLGWFGPACQYKASLYTAEGKNLTWLTDSDVGTCNNGSAQPISLTLESPHPLTWIRVRLREPGLIGSLQLRYRTEKDPSSDQPCVSAQTAKVDVVTMDISCPTAESVAQLILSGPGVDGLCSVDISAGRNVAIYQNARQSSTYDTWYARNAVDGGVGKEDGSDNDLKKTCTHTNSRYPDANWSLEFDISRVEINSIVIYNRRNPGRNGCCEGRLIGFTLQAYNVTYDGDSSDVFKYTDPGPDYQDIYYITPSPSIEQPVKTIRITNAETSKILTLCEVIVFGDSACPPGKFGRECERDCNCVDQEKDCFVSTGGCPSGCAAGYTGEDCQTPCASGTYGLECLQTCSRHCTRPGECHFATGECTDGCQIGYQKPLCKEECPDSKYGQDCQMTCSNRCLYQMCDHVSGFCRGCEQGYIGDICDEECSAGLYGAVCQNNCSVHCLDQLCDHVTGKCDNCTVGRRGDYCDEVIVKERVRTGGASNSVIIGVVVGVTLAIIVLATIILVLRWRGRMALEDGESHELKGTAGTRTPSSPTKPAIPDRPPGTLEPTMKVSDDGPDNIYSNVMPRNTAVAVKDLKAYLYKHARDSFLQDQFESVPLVNSYSQKHGAANRSKNRYKNILPYDHSRVLLNNNLAKKHEDYINASYIKGYKDPQEVCIAAQGPNDTILHDFVRMVWEKDVDRIVMLTNLVEGRKTKCTMYWPQDEEETYGEITMQLLTTLVFAEYTVRQLRLTKSGEKPREVTQFHFTAWPDNSVPDSPWGLVDFQQRVLATPGSGSLLVHCSAGVGRTGTFIALCHLLQEAEATGKMDFLSTLWRLRQDRMQMIQTVDQYVFLHWAALVAHLTAGMSIQVKDISQKLQDMDQGGYKTEFYALTAATANDMADGTLSEDEMEDVYQNSRVAINKQKNRLNNILPKDAYRPELTCEIKTMGKYINAVLVPTKQATALSLVELNFLISEAHRTAQLTLTKNRQDILTQLPLPSTVTDFWRLVTQYHVGLVVALEAESRDTDETIGEFLPSTEDEPLKSALFEVQASPKEESRLWQELHVTVFKKRRSLLGQSCEQHHLTCLLCKDASSAPETVLEYLKKIKSCRPGDQLRTLYMCRNGAEYCGLMCVQSILLDRLDAGHSLTVPLVVGAVKAIRPQVIPTVSQYKCLYDVLKLVDNTNNVYGNIGDVRSTAASPPTTNADFGANRAASKKRRTSHDIPEQEERPAITPGSSLRKSGRSTPRDASSPLEAQSSHLANGTAAGTKSLDETDSAKARDIEEYKETEYANM